jgi:hypothetical protein
VYICVCILYIYIHIKLLCISNHIDKIVDHHVQQTNLKSVYSHFIGKIGSLFLCMVFRILHVTDNFSTFSTYIIQVEYKVLPVSDLICATRTGLFLNEHLVVLKNKIHWIRTLVIKPLVCISFITGYVFPPCTCCFLNRI